MSGSESFSTSSPQFEKTSGSLTAGAHTPDVIVVVARSLAAGTGAETNAFGVVTDPQTSRKFYVGHASSLPVAAILDPDLTIGLPPSVTAATGMDALTHALESYLSVRANPWSDGIALQVIRMIATHLPRAHADGGDHEQCGHDHPERAPTGMSPSSSGLLPHSKPPARGFSPWPAGRAPRAGASVVSGRNGAPS